MTNWMARGFCVSANPDIFSEPEHTETAKAYCQRCVVTGQCLEWAMNENEEGVWGGTTTDERRALKRGGPRKTCPGCGSSKIFSDGRSEICLACSVSWIT